MKEYEKNLDSLCRALKKGRHYEKGINTTLSVFLKKIWQLSQQNVVYLLEIKKLKQVTSKAHITKKQILMSVESIIMDQVYETVITILFDIHSKAEHKIEMVYKKLNGKIEPQVLGLSSDLQNLPLEGAVSCLRKITEKKTPNGKLQVVSKTIKKVLACVDNLSKDSSLSLFSNFVLRLKFAL